MSIDIVISAASYLQSIRLRPPMRRVLQDAFAAWPYPICTIPDGSVYRPFAEEKAKGRSGVHGTDDLDHGGHRAVDIPTADWPIAAKIAVYVNARWVYDPSRPGKTVAYADAHGTAPHCHLQVHPNTHHKPDPMREV